MSSYNREVTAKRKTANKFNEIKFSINTFSILDGIIVSHQT